MHVVTLTFNPNPSGNVFVNIRRKGEHIAKTSNINSLGPKIPHPCIERSEVWRSCVLWIFCYYSCSYVVSDHSSTDRMVQTNRPPIDTNYETIKTFWSNHDRPMTVHCCHRRRCCWIAGSHYSPLTGLSSRSHKADQLRLWSWWHPRECKILWVWERLEERRKDGTSTQHVRSLAPTGNDIAPPARLSGLVGDLFEVEFLLWGLVTCSMAWNKILVCLIQRAMIEITNTGQTYPWSPKFNWHRPNAMPYHVIERWLWSLFSVRFNYKHRLRVRDFCFRN